MNTLKKILIFLLFITVSGGQRNSKLSTLDSWDKHCHSSQCPTWYICNSYDTFECGNGHNLAITCDSKTVTSAVLDCHCVTYNNHSISTLLGSFALVTIRSNELTCDISRYRCSTMAISVQYPKSFSASISLLFHLFTIVDPYWVFTVKNVSRVTPVVATASLSSYGSMSNNAMAMNE